MEEIISLKTSVWVGVKEVQDELVEDDIFY